MSSTFPLNNSEFPDGLESLVNQTWTSLGSWRGWILAIDGRDGIGKSVLARYLAYRLNMPVSETDNFLLGDGTFDHNDCLNLTFRKRHDRNNPTIVEGIFAAKTLEKIGLEADLLIRCSRKDELGNDEWRDDFIRYEDNYEPDLIFCLGHSLQV